MIGYIIILLVGLYFGFIPAADRARTRQERRDAFLEAAVKERNNDIR